MATTIGTAFTTMFGDEVTHLAQAMSSNLQGAVRTVRGVRGSTYKFPILGKGGTVKNKVSHDDIEVLSALNAATPPTPAGAATWQGGDADTMDHVTSATATIDTYSTGEYIDTWDALKTNVDLRSAYAESIAGAMNRAYDAEIISALDGTTATAGAEVDDAAGDELNLVLLRKVHSGMNENDVPMNDRFIVVGPTAYDDLISALGSTAAGPFSEALKTGVIQNAFGFTVILNTGLTAGAGTSADVNKKCYAFSKNAIGMAVGQDITTRVDYVPQKLATLISAEFAAGAIMIDPSAVYSFSA